MNTPHPPVPYRPRRYLALWIGFGLAAALYQSGYAAVDQVPASSGAKPANKPSTADKRAQEDFARKLACGAEHAGPPDMVQLNTTFMELDGQLPNIPPEEAAYLQREDAALLTMSGQQADATVASRYTALVSRRLYYAWKARSAFDRAKIAVNAVYDPDHMPTGELSAQTLGVQLFPKPLQDERADRIYRLIVSVEPVADAVSAVTDFINRDAWNANRLMTEQQRASVRLKLYAAPIYLQNALACHFVTYVLNRK